MTTPVNSSYGTQNFSTVGDARGIASIYHPDTGYFRFRTNPNEISWTYTLNTKIENTYGGRVIQILSTKIDDLTVKVECGRGGWDYLMQVCTYFRDLLVDQRKGEPATFEYTTRQWKFDVFATSIPFQDDVKATTRELTLNFKVQEDISGVVSSSIVSAELKRFGEGIGFKRTEYNTGMGFYEDYENPAGAVMNQAVNLGNSVANAVPG